MVFRGVGSPRVCGGPGAGLVLFLLRAFRDRQLSLCGHAEATSGRGPSQGVREGDVGTASELQDARGSGGRLGAARCPGLWGPTWSCKMPGALGADLELQDAWALRAVCGAWSCCCPPPAPLLLTTADLKPRNGAAEKSQPSPPEKPPAGPRLPGHSPQGRPGVRPAGVGCVSLGRQRPASRGSGA